MVEKQLSVSCTRKFCNDGTINLKELPDGDVYLEVLSDRTIIHREKGRGFKKRSIRGQRMYASDLYPGEQALYFTLSFAGEAMISVPEHRDEDMQLVKRKSGYIDPNKTQLFLKNDFWSELDSDARPGEVLVCHAELGSVSQMKLYYSKQQEDIRLRPPLKFVPHAKDNITDYIYYVNRYRGLIAIPLMFKKTFGLIGGMVLNVEKVQENGRMVIVVNMPDRTCEITGNTITSKDAVYSLTVRPETKEYVTDICKATSSMSGTFSERLKKINSEELAVELLKSEIIKNFIKEELKS